MNSWLGSGLLGFAVFLIVFSDARLRFIAQVQVKSIAKGQVVTGGNDEIARRLVRQLLKIMFSERVRGEKTIVTHVPPRWVPGVLRMIENRNSNDLAVNRAVIVAPVRSLAPGVPVPHALAIDDVALSHRPFEPHGFSQSHRHGSLFRITKGELAIRRMKRYLEIKYPLGSRLGLIDPQSAVVGAHDNAFPSDPFILRTNDALRFPGLYPGEGLMNRFAEILFLGPKVVAVDGPVSEPKRAMVRMIMLLVRSGFHRPVARHRRLAWADYGITVGAGNILKKIFGEQIPIDFDAQPVLKLGNVHSFARTRGVFGGGRRAAAQQEQTKAGQKQGPQHG
jgi:hypothetical protein